MAFQRATIQQSHLRMALLGPSGSGKTYTALAIGSRLGKRLAVIDTEHRSACKYADQFTFDTAILETFSPQLYIETIKDAGKAGYDVLLIDSLSHAWSGPGGLLEFVDNFSKRNQGNSFSGWRDATPLHNQLVEAILSYPGHVIATMRVKMEHVQEKDPRTGKTTIRKVGLQPVQRDGMEYEFDVIGDIDMEHNLIISKTRCFALTDKVFHRAGQDVADILLPWLNGGSPRETAPPIQHAAQVAPVAQPASTTAATATEPKPKRSATLTAQQQAIFQQITALSRHITVEDKPYFDSAKWKAFLKPFGGESLPTIATERWPEVLTALHALQEELLPSDLDMPEDMPDDLFADQDDIPATSAPDEDEVKRQQMREIMQIAERTRLLDEQGGYTPEMFRLLAHNNLGKKKLKDMSVMERQVLIAALETAEAQMQQAATN